MESSLISPQQHANRPPSSAGRPRCPAPPWRQQPARCACCRAWLLPPGASPLPYPPPAVQQQKRRQSRAWHTQAGRQRGNAAGPAVRQPHQVLNAFATLHATGYPKLLHSNSHTPRHQRPWTRGRVPWIGSHSAQPAAAAWPQRCRVHPAWRGPPPRAPEPHRCAPHLQPCSKAAAAQIDAQCQGTPGKWATERSS